MSQYPEIKPPFASGLHLGDKFKPYERDPETLVRKWAVPGMKGYEHRVGGLEKNHDGVLSNDPENHAAMVAEREEKIRRISKYIPELKVEGPASGKLLIVGWGGTFGHLLTAYHTLVQEGREVSFAHFEYIKPLPRNTEAVFAGFEKIIVCELNSGMFCAYLRGLFPDKDFRQYNKVQGQPFLVSELVEAIRKEL